QSKGSEAFLPHSSASSARVRPMGLMHTVNRFLAVGRAEEFAPAPCECGRSGQSGESAPTEATDDGPIDPFTRTAWSGCGPPPPPVRLRVEPTPAPASAPQAAGPLVWTDPERADIDWRLETAYKPTAAGPVRWKCRSCLGPTRWWRSKHGVI